MAAAASRASEAAVGEAESEPIEFALTLHRPRVWVALSVATSNRNEGHVWVVPLEERRQHQACLWVVDIVEREEGCVEYGDPRLCESVTPSQVQQKVHVMRAFRLQNPDVPGQPLPSADAHGVLELDVPPHTMEQRVVEPLRIDVSRHL